MVLQPDRGAFLILTYGLTRVGHYRWESWLHELFPMPAALFGWLAWWVVLETFVYTARSPTVQIDAPGKPPTDRLRQR